MLVKHDANDGLARAVPAKSREQRDKLYAAMAALNVGVDVASNQPIP